MATTGQVREGPNQNSQVQNTSLVFEVSSSITVPPYPGLELAFYIITRYIPIGIIVIGFLGNFMAFAVATKKSNRNLSTCRYMAGLAIMDNIELSMLAATTSIFWGAGRGSSGQGLAFRTCFYLADASGITSGLFLAEMSIDRAIVVWAPMKAKRLCTTTRANIVMVITTILSFGIDSNMFWTYAYSEDPVSGFPLLVAATPDAPIYSTLCTAYQFAFGTFIPFLTIMSCNIAIIIGVQRASRRRSKLSAAPSSGQSEGKYLMRMLLMVSLAYVFCSIPMRMYYLILESPAMKTLYNFKYRYWFIRYSVEYWSVCMLWQMNYAVNFYMYVIGGGHKFRQDVLDVFSRFCDRTKQSKG